MRCFAWAVVLVTLAALPAKAAEPKAVRVHIFARSREPLGETDKKAREKETDAERKRLERARKDLDKSLEARHGKRAKDWPEDARGQSEEAWRAELRAELAHQQVKVDPKDLANFAKSLANALRHETRDSPGVTLADAADHADLAVEVLARASRTSFPAAAWMLYVEIRPVGWAAKAQFAGTAFEQPRTKKLGIGLLANLDVVGAVTTLHLYTEPEPYWVIRFFQQGTGYGDVLSTAAEILAAFAGDLAEPAQEAKR